jgi:hypothetical protein
MVVPAKHLLHVKLRYNLMVVPAKHQLHVKQRSSFISSKAGYC